MPHSVEVRDTTGAGDAFRAGVIDDLLRGESDEGIVTTAGAVAAMVCRTSPGVLKSPTRQELDDCLAESEEKSVR
jgi:sugar/nucleoside kinase (ribokinase family)